MLSFNYCKYYSPLGDIFIGFIYDKIIRIEFGGLTEDNFILNMNDKEDLKYEIPTHAYISLARRGMEKISLDQCFLKNCDNQDSKLLEPIKKEEYDEENKHIKNIYIKCKICEGIFILRFETF